MRRNTIRAARLASVGSVIAVFLAGCGGSATADSNGFTPADREAARNALAVLAQTSVYDAALKISLTQAKVPTRCVVHIDQRDPLKFELFMTWVPDPDVVAKGYLRSYAWLQAVIGKDGIKGDYSFHQGNELNEADLKAHYGDAFSKPASKCLVLQNRRFGLLPA
jgi:hypothetical protein